MLIDNCIDINFLWFIYLFSRKHADIKALIISNDINRPETRKLIKHLLQTKTLMLSILERESDSNGVSIYIKCKP